MDSRDTHDSLIRETDTTANAQGGMVRNRSFEPITPTDNEIAAFLKANPDFLTENPDVMAPDALRAWDAPVDADNVVDLNRMMMSRLRKRGEETTVAFREYRIIQRSVHRAVEQLMEAGSFSAAVGVITYSFPRILDLDVVRLCLEGSVPSMALDEMDISPWDLGVLEPGMLDFLVDPEQPIRMVRNARDDGTVFGEDKDRVESTALIRLDWGGAHTGQNRQNALSRGLLALGSSDPKGFHAQIELEPFGFLGRMVEITLARWLAPTSSS